MRIPLGEWGEEVRGTGWSRECRVVEEMEVNEHPFMIGSQCNPEFASRPEKPHPLFKEFVGTACRALREGGQYTLLPEAPALQMNRAVASTELSQSNTVTE